MGGVIFIHIVLFSNNADLLLHNLILDIRRYIICIIATIIAVSCFPSSMPVLHRHEDESGYYFRAKPSGLNTPITYQVHDSARSFFCDLGYRDGDSVPWEVIQPLRAIGHIYTNGQGVEEGDPADSISGKIAELSTKGREKLRLNLPLFECKVDYLLFPLLNLCPSELVIVGKALLHSQVR